MGAERRVFFGFSGVVSKGAYWGYPGGRGRGRTQQQTPRYSMEHPGRVWLKPVDAGFPHMPNSGVVVSDDCSGIKD